jgi:N-methylhydantoinase A
VSWRIGIDVGGTFTDVVALNESTGERRVVKTSSTPADPSEGFGAGLDLMLADLAVEPSEVAMVLHGTTVATNAILEGKYARLGLIVNRGFREMLECARQTVPGDLGNILWWIKPPRIVPLELIREVSARHDAEGNQLRPVDPDEVRLIAQEYRQSGISAIAVSLLHSYRNPEHEQQVRELIANEYPDCFVSVSSDVIREYREYERTVSTCLNTGLMPGLSSYVGVLDDRMRRIGMNASLHIMKSSGGVAHAPELVSRPIGAVLSGPAAGVIAACAIASAAGHEDVLTLDMGGTSTDIALIEGSAPRLLSEGKIDIYDVKAPMVDMTAVGAGGGSIAWLTEAKGLRVGPQSAGASPGPVCYGRGGTAPTVTDANVVLGRISPYLLGGGLELDEAAAKQAIEEQIADPLGLDVDKAADGILQLAINSIAAGIRLVSVKRGRDPRRYVLFPFGGAGPLHACLVAESLGITRIIVPHSPGATSAEGLLQADVRVDHVVTAVQREDALDPKAIATEIRALIETAERDLRGQGLDDDALRYEAFAEIRYSGQAYELRLPLRSLEIDEQVIRDAISDFHEAHEDRFGYSYAGAELTELVNVGVVGIGDLKRPKAVSAAVPERSWEAAAKYTREMYDRHSGQRVTCTVYDRLHAPANEPLAGPAILEQYDTTIVLETGWIAHSSQEGQLLLTAASDWHSTQEGSSNGAG